MRPDMAKVIVERPRIKRWAWLKPKGYARELGRYGEDGPPEREGIKERWRETKALNEHLGPLRRYLEAQVGRPWDKVFSEICAHINRNSAVQDHVRDHVDDYVARHVILINGVPCEAEGAAYGQPLRERRWHYLYVCPRTGILKRVKVPSRRRRSTEVQKARYVFLSKTLQCRLFPDGWYLLTLKPFPLEPFRCAESDVVLQRPVRWLSADVVRQFYGTEVYAVAKRPMGKRELSQLPVSLPT